ncbi:MAG: adenosylmethionine--8-amino-7-oxononanoate transaminase [Deltaproteobacteria bacterium]|nr:adenosylmethionine--8-amino-7-oxononanoate transaminase [Deltaproteobacteria bacterium]MBW1953045.1 adenosylmethionine--8-amino-7-oxononanoate transaminase [Deltaproteobacteria bacterium]MBW2133681.1 adenosylmethionine--8-amino-7-oxononanoate transaminase [Deltaproteobacteria bacterium]
MQPDYQTLVDWDHRYLWHPFTQMQGFVQEELVIIVRGEGVYVYDTDNRRYLDGVSSIWAIVHGHCRPELNQAITAQLAKIAHSTLLGLGNIPALQLAQRLVAITPPGLNKVFYSDNGSTAVEVALKLAYRYWQLKGEPNRRRFLKLAGAYHGDTLGAVAVGGIEIFHSIFKDLLFPTYMAPATYCYRCPNQENCQQQCLAALEDLVAAHHQELAAIILEPIMQGAAGMIPQPPGYLAKVRQVADRYGVLLIADEVATGFGRTGKMFACEHEGVAPDLLCLGKGITGGYLPLAATLATDQIYEQFLGGYQEFKTFFHGHTYTGNPLAAAVALASLDLFETDRILEQLADKIAYLSQRLAALADQPHIGEIRQRGFMVGIELVQDRATRKPFPVSQRIGYRVILEARKLGAILRPLGDVVVLMPPLCISQAELAELLDITSQAIDRATRK